MKIKQIIKITAITFLSISTIALADTAKNYQADGHPVSSFQDIASVQIFCELKHGDKNFCTFDQNYKRYLLTCKGLARLFGYSFYDKKYPITPLDEPYVATCEN